MAEDDLNALLHQLSTDLLRGLAQVYVSSRFFVFTGARRGEPSLAEALSGSVALQTDIRPPTGAPRVCITFARGQISSADRGNRKDLRRNPSVAELSDMLWSIATSSKTPAGRRRIDSSPPPPSSRVQPARARAVDQPTWQQLDSLRAELEQIVATTSAAEQRVWKSLLATLEETVKCLRAECPTAVLCLCGKLLEVALKEKLYRCRATENLQNLMIGQLLSLVPRYDKSYLASGLKNVVNSINQSRIGAVHAGTPFFPSIEHAQGAVNFTMDVLRRTYFETDGSRSAR